MTGILGPERNYGKARNAGLRIIWPGPLGRWLTISSVGLLIANTVYALNTGVWQGFGSDAWIIGAAGFAVGVYLYRWVLKEAFFISRKENKKRQTEALENLMKGVVEIKEKLHGYRDDELCGLTKDGWEELFYLPIPAPFAHPDDRVAKQIDNIMMMSYMNLLKKSIKAVKTVIFKVITFSHVCTHRGMRQDLQNQPFT